MDKKLNEQYESPLVEVIEVEVEQGFAVSGEGVDPQNEDW